MKILDISRKYFENHLPNEEIGSLIGSGIDGEVYSIANDINKCIKYSSIIFDEEKETAKEVFEEYQKKLNLIKNSHYVHVFEKGFIGHFSNRCIYYTIMEKLESLSDDEVKIFHTLLSHEDSNIKKNFSYKKMLQILDEFNYSFDFNKQNILLFCQSIKNHLIKNTDLVPRNIMKLTYNKNINYKLIDLDRLKYSFDFK